MAIRSRITKKVMVKISGASGMTETWMEVSILTALGALKRGLLCWAAIYTMGLLAELIPIVHLFLPPFWIIIGPYVCLRVFRSFSHSIDTVKSPVECTECRAVTQVELAAAKDPTVYHCNRCSAKMNVHYVAGDFLFAKQQLYVESREETKLLVRKFPWPFNSLERARVLPSLLLHTSVFAFTVCTFLTINWLGSAAYFMDSAMTGASMKFPTELSYASRLLLTLVVMLFTASFFGSVFRRFNQPAVMGEVLAGIVLGPSLLGMILPQFHSHVMTADVSQSIKALSEVGVVLFMALVGIDLNLSELKKKSHTALAISHGSIVVPFVGGCIVSLLLYSTGAAQGASFTVFSLFVGLAMSITAFPVLARITDDLKIAKTSLGTMALACASVDDIVAWCLLALVMGISKGNITGFVFCICGLILFVFLFFRFITPQLRRIVDSVETKGAMTTPVFAWVCLLILGSALITEWIGVHPLFGAFLMGTVIPHQSLLGKEFSANLRNFALTFLLPAFFVYSGMRTEVALLSSGTDWALCAAVVLVAVLGKVGGAFITARLTGMEVRESLVLGILLNTRGLVELVVLNIGLDLGIINQKLFTMMVIMAVVTTLMTGPLVARLLSLNFSKLESLERPTNRMTSAP